MSQANVFRNSLIVVYSIVFSCVFLMVLSGKGDESIRCVKGDFFFLNSKPLRHISFLTATSISLFISSS